MKQTSNLSATLRLLLVAMTFIGVSALGSCAEAQNQNNKAAIAKKMNDFPIQKSEEDWKKELSPMQYQVLRQKGTERAFTGAYWDNHEKGVYKCAGCHTPLFSSETKFDSGTGWPSFYAALDKTKVREIRDVSHGMVRTEVVCGQCGGHLGHVFDDGPKPTGMRYCMNSVSLEFDKGGK